VSAQDDPAISLTSPGAAVNIRAIPLQCKYISLLSGAVLAKGEGHLIELTARYGRHRPIDLEVQGVAPRKVGRQSSDSSC
jgi:hypothetical protein